MKKMALILLAVPLVASAAPAALDMKSALLQTLAGPVNGQPVVGVMAAGSPQLKMISGLTGSTEPAKITMTKVQNWNKPGCGRLKLVFHQDKMKLKAGGTSNDFSMTQFLDVCADGTVPEVPVMPQSQSQSGGSPAMSVKPGK